jgi:hypothetical protein
VSATLVQRYIEALLDAATTGNEDYTYTKTLKKGRRFVEELRPYRIRLGVNKAPSQTLLDDLKHGEIKAIKLIKRNVKYTGVSSPNIVNSIQETLTVRTKSVEDNFMQDYVRRVKEWARGEGYSEIQFDVKDTSGGGSASPRFALDIADAMDTLYSRSLPITGRYSKLAMLKLIRRSPEKCSRCCLMRKTGRNDLGGKAALLAAALSADRAGLWAVYVQVDI